MLTTLARRDFSSSGSHPFRRSCSRRACHTREKKKGPFAGSRASVPCPFPSTPCPVRRYVRLFFSSSPRSRDRMEPVPEMDRLAPREGRPSRTVTRLGSAHRCSPSFPDPCRSEDPGHGALGLSDELVMQAYGLRTLAPRSCSVRIGGSGVLSTHSLARLSNMRPRVGPRHFFRSFFYLLRRLAVACRERP